MKSLLAGLFLLLVGTPAFAQAGPIFNYIPDGATLQSPQGRGPLVLLDSRGFYMGYYRPGTASTIVNPLGTANPAGNNAPPSNGYSGAGGYGYGGYTPVPAVINPMGTSSTGYPSLNTGFPSSSSGPSTPQSYSSSYYYYNGSNNSGQITNPLGVGTPSSSNSGSSGGHHRP